jgi:hypothetical protein
VSQLDKTFASMHRQTLLALWPYVRIAHHLPGRLRLRMRPGAAIDQTVRRHAETGEEALRQLPGVRSIRLNALAGSLLLEYDPERLPFSLVDAFFHATGSTQAGELLDRLLSYHPH